MNVTETFVIDLPKNTIPIIVLEDDSVFELDKNKTFYFGANEECDIQRCLPGIEKIQFSIRRVIADKWMITDLAEKAIIKVNDEPLNDYRLLDNGDVIETHWSSFVFWDVVQ